ncbi:HEPN domain-containing protein [Cellulomonas endometrii]|uniref:HEPN domain-containing protein n=1 Tax=Cellulomonas endometrii TaxID=3036301 RepID=UPI0024AD2A44|nr:HEPN domain-containing protein [Cellulomonas endometrii]
MTDDKLWGRFWLPEGQDQSVGGWLDLSGRWPRLELADPLTGDRLTPTGDGGWKRDVTAGSDRIPVVHGMLRAAPNRITLIDAHTVSRQRNWGSGVPDPGTQALRADHAVRGLWSGGAEQTFTIVEIRLNHLDEWAELPGLSLEIEDKPNGRVSIAHEPQDVTPVAVRDPAGTLTLTSRNPLPNLTFRGARLDRGAYVRWEADSGDPGLTVDQILARLVGPMVHAVSTAMDARCLPESVRVARADTPLADLHFATRVDPEPERARVAIGSDLLTRTHFGLTHLATWLERAPVLNPIPAVLLQSFSDPDRPIESQVLDLATAAEGLHRRLHPSDRRMSRRQADRARKLARDAVDADLRDLVNEALTHLGDWSFRDRLQSLVSTARAVPVDVVGNADEWVDEVAKARNGFAHQLTASSTRPIEDEIRHYARLRDSLRWLLSLVLLLDAGVVPAVLGERLAQHERFRRLRRRAS